ncbi:hypothetical protein TNCV_118611 [Trichonephila clavipes]|nr:hypothetical protein TNCV_118611 [Trichonephila clavipes]
MLAVLKKKVPPSNRCVVSDPVPVVVPAMRRGEIVMNPSPSSVSLGKLPTRKTQPTFRTGTLSSTFAGLKEDTRTKDSLAADQR